MIFHCTLVAGPLGQSTLVPGSTPRGRLIELATEVPDACPGADLEAALARCYGTGELFVRGARVAAMTIGTAPLVHGAVLVENSVLGDSPALVNASGAISRPGHAETAALLLAVHGGPGAGTLVALRRGRFRIGRRGAGIVIPDPALSREHACLDVSDADVTIVDLGSANGTSVDGRKVRRATVTTASSIRCGDSIMSLRLGTPAMPDVTESLAARAGSSVAEPLVVRSTAGPSHRSAVALAAVLPILVGVGLALLTGMWMFLAFTAVSAVSVLVPLWNGRRERRELAAAIAGAALQDLERRRQAAPSAADLVLSLAAGAPAPEATGPGEPQEVWLRMGLVEQRANIRLEPPEPAFLPPPLGPVPVTLDPAWAVVTVHGPAAAAAGLIRSLILQLAAFPLAGSTGLLVHGPVDAVPLAARFLPGVTLSANEATTAGLLTAGPGETADRGILILWAGPEQPGAAAGAETAAAGPPLRSLATAHGWRVIECSPALHPQPHPEAHPGIVLGRRAALVRAGAPPLEFVPDLVPPEVFDRFCRGFNGGGHTRAVSRPAIPRRCSLADVLPLGATDISRRWTRSGPAAGLGVTVGAGSSASMYLDLQADGPHFLVAGTTGSGKSEFLRTLAAGLAASHPPERVNLLFIDFKGGSGLGPLTGLPHCVGMLTDLGAAEMDRTLVSLRAEVRRREELLARAGVPDLAGYERSLPPGPAVPYLVIVIDEFRVLVDEAPAALAELMRIAAIGRSLGIHLVMATQRPQGTVNADIRANVTTCIALRVQTGPESMDVMGSGLAATIPIARPGRAFLVRGSQTPEEFQTATLAPGTTTRTKGTVTVRTVADALTRPHASAGPGTGGSPDGQDHACSAAPVRAQGPASLIDVVADLWHKSGGQPLRRPVADPLPALLQPLDPAPADPDTGSDTERDSVRLGRVDLPELQRVTELAWSPTAHGHLGLIGTGAGGSEMATALAVNQVLTGAVESHVYILDATGAFSTVAAASRVGAVVGLHELRRAARVLQRVAEEVTARLGAPASTPRPPLVLVLSGWGAWVSGFRSGPLAWAEDLVHDIVRDGSRAGITVLVSGERELVTARFFAALPNRIYFPAGSTEEGRLAWPRLPTLEPIPGRVAVFGPFVPASSAAGHAAQLFEPQFTAGHCPAEGAVSTAPFRVDALPALVTVGEVLARSGVREPDRGQRRGKSPPGATITRIPGETGAPVRAAALLIGVAGDELAPHRLLLPAGGVLAVLGGPGSGKSTLLAALPAMNPAETWLAPPAGTDPVRYWSGAHASALAGTLNRTAIALADDADLLPHEANSSLAVLNSLGWRVVLAAGFGPAFGERVTLASMARGQGRAVLIRPRGLLDGELFGVRFEPEQSPPAGRAVVLFEGRAIPVQLAALPDG